MSEENLLRKKPIKELTKEEHKLFVAEIKKEFDPETLENLKLLGDAFLYIGESIKAIKSRKEEFTSMLNQASETINYFTDFSKNAFRFLELLEDEIKKDKEFSQLSTDDFFDRLSEPNSEILQKVEDRFKKELEQQGISKKETTEIAKETRKEVDTAILEPYPTSQATHYVNLIFNSMGSKRELKVNKDTKLENEITEQGEYTATFTNNRGTTIINIENITDIVSRYDKHLKKIFVFLLQRANYTHFNEANFYLSDLVNMGIYSNIESARAGLKRVMKKLTSIKVSGEFKKGRKSIKSGFYVLFTALEIENNYCTVTINSKLNTSFIAPFFTLLPNWSYILNNKAFSLIEYIFYLARQNTNEIKNKGHFNISFTAINNYLQQPDPAYTHNHTRDIIDPILNAVTEIEEAQTGTDYKFTPIYPHNYKSVTEFLKEGYLQIELTDEALIYFIERATSQENELAKAQKIKEKALLETEKKKLKK